MAGDPNRQIYENVCAQLLNLSVKLLRSFAVMLLYLSMELRVKESNTSVQHFSIKIL